MKELILRRIEVSDFFYHNRKDDELVPRGAIEKAIEEGVISKQEIIDEFTKQINEALT